MSLLIKNGRIITATDDYTADIFCENETITKIGPSLEPPAGAEVIDASGKYVFPGFIDPHVHIYLPFMGTYSKDDHTTGSRAALIGGTTTFVEMCCPSRQEEPGEAFELWNSKAAGNSACDYSFHIGVTRWDESVERQLRELVTDGLTSFKVFLAYKGAFGVTDDELYHALKLASELGVTVTAHCENADLIAARQAELVAEGKVGPEWHEPSRPVQVEAEGVHHFCTFLELTGAKGYIVHTSNQLAVENALAAERRGVNVKIETVIPYLVLDDTYAQKPDFEGAKYVMSPPVRSKEHQDYLWRALADGLIHTVATDHAPFDFVGQKDMGHPARGADFTKIPNGIPSIEDRVNLLYTYGVCEDRISLNQFVAYASTNAAQLFNLPGKGDIAVGADADLVVYDPDYRGTISAKTHHMNVDYSGFEGMTIKGRPAVVTVRGKVQVRDGEFVGEQGHGKLLRRKV
ncbi:MAG: dihydropyrimidinase [Phycisphaeraceae bacterium]